MPSFAARLTVGVAYVLIASTPVVVTTTLAAPVQAAPTCVPPDNPPPRVLSFAATDVLPGSSRTHGYVYQHFTARVDNQCGTVGCPNDPSASCTRASLLVTAKRTAGSGAGCVHHRYTDPSAHSEGAGISIYEADEAWTDNDADDGPTSPQLSNKCAGAYDVSVTVNNDRYDAGTGTTTTTASEPFRQSRSFTVRRPSRLTANASPEPVRVGRRVTVKGRLTRANWDAYSNPQQGYAGQRVLLQRRTSTGTYHTLKSARTDPRGYLRAGVKALSGTRCYRWVFPENATTQGRPSGGDCVRAR